MDLKKIRALLKDAECLASKNSRYPTSNHFFVRIIQGATKLSRRKWIKVTTAVGAAAGTALEGYKHFQESKVAFDQKANKQHFRVLFDLDKSEFLSLSNGEANCYWSDRSAQPRRVSKFRQDAMLHFKSLVDKLVGDGAEQKIGLDALANTKTNNLFLAGPLSSPFVARLSGYEIQDTKSTSSVPPIFFSKKLRWGFFCGDQSFGIFDNKPYQARRYDEQNEVTRPCYGICDNLESPDSPIFYSKPDSPSQWLKLDFLLITRVLNGKATGKSDSKHSVLISGMHGHSLEAFTRGGEILKNLGKLSELVARAGKPDQFQVMIPV
ncbi:MAG: hypothetical protein HY301_16205 [Verrucomicrobia bacterium]|nr:hypothetical protein [Verrucomicrobiota bacterium]